MKSISATTKIAVLVLGLFVLSAFQFSPMGNPNYLWQVISEDCVPNQISNGSPDPCAEVKFENGEQGYVLFKDFNGPLQFLLMPTTRVTGIESPDILKTDSPNYFYRAWESRKHLERLYRGPIPADEISLTLNSQIGRSQNQLHIHISCTRYDVKDLIEQNIASIGSTWSKFPGGILDHDYYARSLSLQELKEKNVVQLLANGIPEAKSKMNEFGLALVPIENKSGEISFVMLASRADLDKKNYGHVEEIQDHECSKFYKKTNTNPAP